MAREPKYKAEARELVLHRLNRTLVALRRDQYDEAHKGASARSYPRFVGVAAPILRDTFKRLADDLEKTIEELKADLA